jgi:ribonuclease HII
MPDWSHEIAAGAADGRIVCGVDEVGRGPLAGPVLACAVVLDPSLLPAGLVAGIDDSKRLTPALREAMSALLNLGPGVVHAIGSASVAEIDRLNILKATHLAMIRAVEALAEALAVKPDHALIDGNRAPKLFCPVTCVVRGDSASLSIAAASILAKVARDKIMRELAGRHTVYGWERNSGYATKEHLAAIKRHGITPEHRRSFRPVSENILITN